MKDRQYSVNPKENNTTCGKVRERQVKCVYVREIGSKISKQ